MTNTKESFGEEMAKEAVYRSKLIHALQENESLKRELEITKKQLEKCKLRFHDKAQAYHSEYTIEDVAHDLASDDLDELDQELNKIREEWK